jgi:hypothetical protein
MILRAGVRHTSVDQTEARKATVRRFGRSDRRAQHVWAAGFPTGTRHELPNPGRSIQKAHGAESNYERALTTLNARNSTPFSTSHTCNPPPGPMKANHFPRRID